jgi:hypothetical protein
MRSNKYHIKKKITIIFAFIETNKDYIPNKSKSELDDSGGELGESEGELGDSGGELGDSVGELDDSEGELGDSRGELGDSVGELDDSEGELGDLGGELGDSEGGSRGMHGHGRPGNIGMHVMFGGMSGIGILGMHRIPGIKHSELPSSILLCFESISTAKNKNHKQINLRISLIKITIKIII